MEKKRAVLIAAAAVVVAAALLAVAYYEFVATDRVTGRVDHKYITGVRDGTTYTLVVFSWYGLNVKQGDVSDLFAGMDLNSSISADLDRELRNRGYELHYFGQIEVGSPDDVNGLEPGDASSYFVSRDDFNRLNLNDSVTLEVARDQRITVRSIH